MAGYTCVKCGETAYSKCVASRSVFPNDQIATMISNAWDIDANRVIPPADKAHLYGDYSDVWSVTIKSDQYGCQDDAEAMHQFVMRIRSVPEATLKHVLCKHSWHLDDEKCDLGCCTRK